MTYSYCECPICEYSVVVLTSELADGYMIACPICWRQSRGTTPVGMIARPALDSDRPEGIDARSVELPLFTCAKCGNQCLSPVSEETARAEFKALHGVYPDEKAKAICDDCFKLEMARQSAGEPRLTLLASDSTIMSELDRMFAEAKNRKPKPN